jgi:predicted helicase
MIPFLRPHQQDTTDAMLAFTKGQIIVPTGGGKTMCMIKDAMSYFANNDGVIVVVAPRILLAQQLCSEFLEFITNAAVLHVHSGETHHFSTTKSALIYNWSKQAYSKQLIFTTYHSLHRIEESGIKVNTIYFDEAHNSVGKKFFNSTKYFSSASDRCYFFTATPKHSATISKPGMNDVDVYGNVICNVPAPDLVKGGYIVPPKVIVKQLDGANGNVFQRDCDHIIESIDEECIGKALICAKATKQIVALIGQTDFTKQMEDRGYSVLYITSKTGAVIDGKKVNREVFFDTLSKWGKDDSKKFVVLHHSILAEGINVSGLEGVIFMRSMDYIAISQTIGRVIRLHHKDVEGMKNGTIRPGVLGDYTKSFGLCVIPTYGNVGISTAKKVQAVVDVVFEKGEPAISVIKR